MWSLQIRAQRYGHPLIQLAKPIHRQQVVLSGRAHASRNEIEQCLEVCQNCPGATVVDVLDREICEIAAAAAAKYDGFWFCHLWDPRARLNSPRLLDYFSYFGMLGSGTVATSFRMISSILKPSA